MILPWDVVLVKKQLVPKFDDKGHFATFGRKGGKKGKKSKSQLELHMGVPQPGAGGAGGSPSFDGDFDIYVKTSSQKTPWYSSTHQQKHPHSPTRSHTATHSNTDPSVATPPSPIRMNDLGKDFITSQEHIDSLVCFPASNHLTHVNLPLPPPR